MKNRTLVSPGFCQRLSRLFGGDPRHRLRGVGDMAIGWGLETRAREERYAQDGLKRNVSRNHPILIFKYTLEGLGAFAFGEKHWRLHPGQAFLAMTPSPYRYWLPKRSPFWRFLWLSIHHRYIVERVWPSLLKTPPVFNLPEDSPLMRASLALLDGVLLGRFPDMHAREESLFRWLCVYERTRDQQRHPAGRREELLEAVRRTVMRRLSRPIDVSVLAASHGLSRTHFSHHFRRTTGRTPAAWVTQLRASEAERRLRETAESARSIAARCGFGSPTQFGRVFRRLYHMTPAAYRAVAGASAKRGTNKAAAASKIAT